MTQYSSVLKTMHKLTWASLISILCFLNSAVSYAQPWSHFKGDATRQSFSTSFNVYPSLSKLWTITDPGEALVNYSSPVHFGTRMFIGDPNGSIRAFSVSPSTMTLPVLNSPLWVFKADGSFYGSPVITDLMVSGVQKQYLYAGSNDDRCQKINPMRRDFRYDSPGL